MGRFHSGNEVNTSLGVDAGNALRSLTACMAVRTKDLHRQAERSGIIAEILKGRTKAQGYALLLRNLLPAYEVMEREISRLKDRPAIRAFARQEIFRSRAILDDLVELTGPDWQDQLPLINPAVQYAGRIELAAADDGMPLIAHAYTRYFGDLSGGQTMKSVLIKSLGLSENSLNFYRFPDIDDPAQLRENIRTEVDTDAAELTDNQSIIEETAEAFRCNIRISEHVQGLLAAGD